MIIFPLVADPFEKLRFDENGSGSISYSEFLRQMYPEDYVSVRCSKDSIRYLGPSNAADGVDNL